jgi:exopolysaccharide production protein ExoQ
MRIALTAFVFLIFFVTDHHLKASTRWRHATAAQISDLVSRVAKGKRRNQIAFLTLFTIPLLLFALGRLHIPNQNSLLVILTAQLAWTNLSFCWAENRLLTLRRVIPWTIVCLTAFSLSQVMVFSEVIKLITGVALISLTIGIAAEIKLGTILKGSKYRFAGTLHPNQQAVNCTLLMFGSLYLVQTGEWSLLPGSVIVAISFAALLLTKSRGTVWATVAAAGFWILSQSHILTSGTLRERFSVWPVIVMVLLIVITGFLVGRRKLGSFLIKTAFMGRVSSATTQLTGRLPLWRFAMQKARERWLLGFGYGSFWNDQRVLTVSKLTGWRFSDAHSIYIDSLLNSGVIGVILLVWLLSLFFVKTASLPSPERSLFWAIGLIVVLNGFLESTFLRPNFFSFAFFLLLSLLGNTAFVF